MPREALVIVWGGPQICATCRTVMHQPRQDCPNPYVCLTGDDCAACESQEIPSS